jgi:uncharacterized protein (DUF2147 family)
MPTPMTAAARSTSTAGPMTRSLFRSVLGALALSSACLLAHGADTTARDRIVGVWLTEGGHGKIEIFRCGSKHCGRTIWIGPVKDQPHPEGKLDVNNPNASKRDRKIIGTTILWGLTYDVEDDVYEEGSIYDPERGKTFSCKAWLKGDDTLLLRGYIGLSLLGQNTTWTRVR